MGREVPASDMRGTDVESAAYKSEAIAGIHETMKGLYKSGEPMIVSQEVV